MRKLFLFIFLLCPVHLWSALSDNLISYWALDEASGNRLDKVVASANDLTSFSSVGQTTGKVYANAALFTSGSSQVLERTDNASVSTGDIDFTVAGWFNPAAVAGVQGLMSKRVDSGNQFEYNLRLNGAGAQFLVSSTGAVGAAVTVSDTTTLVAGTWYFIVAWHDSVNNAIKICINNGTVTSTSTSAGVFNSTAPFWIGDYGGGGNPFGGSSGPCMFWKKVLSAAEITQVYNGGAGLTYKGILGTEIIPHPLTSGFTSVSTSATTASVTTTTNDLLLLTIVGSGTTNSALSSLSGLGLTWESVRAANWNTSGVPTRRIQVFRAMGNGATGSLTWTLTGSDGMAWSLIAFSNCQTGNNGADAIVQSASNMTNSVTSVSVTLSAFGDATNNVAFGAFGINTVGGITPGSGFVEIHDLTYTAPNAELQTQWKIGEDIGVDASFASSDDGAIGIEIKKGTAAISAALISTLEEN